MPVLAIAGGTSPSLGRAIVSALLSSRKATPWTAVILSRSPKVPLWLRAIDPAGSRTKIKVVDYLSPESLAESLENVHTLVSVISAIDGTQPQIQINLLHAAVKAGCQRFAPAQWGFGAVGWERVGISKMQGEGVWEECLKYKGTIECAKFNNGSFMNYFGHGIFFPKSPKEDGETALRKLQEGAGYAVGEDNACQGLSRQGDLSDGSGAFLISLQSGKAELPVRDDGQWPRISITTLKDVGRLVVASLDLHKWEEDMNIVGETLTMREVLAHAEAVSGKKFEVELLKREDLERKKEELAPDDYMGWMWSDFKLLYCSDVKEGGYMDPVVNGLCSDVKTQTVREYLEEHWREYLRLKE